MPKPARKKTSARGAKKPKRKAPTKSSSPAVSSRGVRWDEEELWVELFYSDVMQEYMDTSEKIIKAQENGDKEVLVPTDLAVRAIAGTVNFRDPKIVEAWNRCCDSVGHPEMKRSVEGPKEEPTGKDIVTLRDITVYKPIRFKKRTKDSEGGSGAGGPF